MSSEPMTPNERAEYNKRLLRRANAEAERQRQERRKVEDDLPPEVLERINAELRQEFLKSQEPTLADAMRQRAAEAEELRKSRIVRIK